MRELSIPPDARTAQESVEVIRSWIIDGGHQCALFPTIWGDRPETWGLLLADVAQHIADAVAAQGAQSREEILRSIASRFASEIAEATCEREGEFIDHPPDHDRGA